MRALGIVPARGGSKGIPRKNLRLLAGEPLLVHTLRAAQAAKSLDLVIVSTEDEEICRVAEENGVRCVRRPPDLATDESSTEAALLHALDTLNVEPEFVVTLEPTSPLRTSVLIDACVDFAEEVAADSVITVAPSYSCYGNFDGSVFRYLDPDQPRRRQLRAPLHRETSTVYVTRTASLRATGSVLAEPQHALVVSEEEAVDINTEIDLALAEALLLRRSEVGS